MPELNVQTIVVGLILLAVVALAVRSILRQHRRGGCSGCSCGCEGCGGSGSCGGHTEPPKKA